MCFTAFSASQKDDLDPGGYLAKSGFLKGLYNASTTYSYKGFNKFQA